MKGREKDRLQEKKNNYGITSIDERFQSDPQTSGPFPAHTDGVGAQRQSIRRARRVEEEDKKIHGKTNLEVRPTSCPRPTDPLQTPCRPWKPAAYSRSLALKLQLFDCFKFLKTSNNMMIR
jgi:hypothetical protein